MWTQTKRPNLQILNQLEIQILKKPCKYEELFFGTFPKIIGKFPLAIGPMGIVHNKGSWRVKEKRVCELLYKFINQFFFASYRLYISSTEPLTYYTSPVMNLRCYKQVFQMNITGSRNLPDVTGEEYGPSIQYCYYTKNDYYTTITNDHPCPDQGKLLKFCLN